MAAPTLLTVLNDALTLPVAERHELARLLAASRIEPEAASQKPSRPSASSDDRVAARIFEALKCAHPSAVSGEEVSKIAKPVTKGGVQRALSSLLEGGMIEVETIPTGKRPRKEYRYALPS